MARDLHPLPELVSFIDSLAEPHILCDREYRILAANKAYRSKCADHGDVVGRTCYEVSHHYAVPCDQAGESCPLAQTLKSGQRERVLHLHHTPAGERYENIELSPLRNAEGEVTYFIEKLEPLPVARGLAAAQGLIGRAPAFRAMLELVARVAPSAASVLLQGESGTGKELVAQAIHDASRRAGGPFVAVDCSGLSEPLFESELFGHERGAFTGATTRKIGLIEAASGGTLFIDELGDIPLAMQVKLLRLLETATYRRVGSTDLQRADIRLISATHRPLDELVANGRFRQDLYFRLNTFPIQLPPLRERREDIPLLAESMLRRVAPERRLSLAPETLERLMAHSFPGNVRELRNVLERASLMADGDVLLVRHLDARIGAVPSTNNNRRVTRTDAELATRLAAHHGSRAEFARAVGLSERTLYRRLRALHGT
jgi:DNA-binding NtrC family response regulator